MKGEFKDWDISHDESEYGSVYPAFHLKDTNAYEYDDHLNDGTTNRINDRVK